MLITMRRVQVYVAKEVGEAHGKELLKTGASLLVRGTLSETPEGAAPNSWPQRTQPLSNALRRKTDHSPCRRSIHRQHRSPAACVMHSRFADPHSGVACLAPSLTLR